ncbi:hypothetical protein BJX96DRAFT_59869 [Aspergillus floccosus]
MNHRVCFSFSPTFLILHPAYPPGSPTALTGNVSSDAVLTWMNVFVPLVRFLPLRRPPCVSGFGKACLLGPRGCAWCGLLCGRLAYIVSLCSLIKTTELMSDQARDLSSGQSMVFKLKCLADSLFWICELFIVVQLFRSPIGRLTHPILWPQRPLCIQTTDASHPDL